MILFLRSVFSEIEVLQSIYLEELLVNRKEDGWDDNEPKLHNFALLALAIDRTVDEFN